MTLQFRTSDISASAGEEHGISAGAAPVSDLGPGPASEKYSPRTSAQVILGLSALLWGIIIIAARASLSFLG